MSSCVRRRPLETLKFVVVDFHDDSSFEEYVHDNIEVRLTSRFGVLRGSAYSEGRRSSLVLNFWNFIPYIHRLRF